MKREAAYAAVQSFRNLQPHHLMNLLKVNIISKFDEIVHTEKEPLNRIKISYSQLNASKK